jgi:hypothetical protein
VDWDWLRFWEWTSATWSGLQFVALVVAAGFALYEARQARALRRAQAAPFIVVDVDVDDRQQTFIVIANTGNTVAENVRLKFDPELRSSWDEKPNLVPLRKTKAFAIGIAALGPGKQFRAFYDTLFARERETFPSEHIVAIRYDAPALKEKNLPRTTAIDLGIYWDLLIPERKQERQRDTGSEPP